MTLAEIEQAIKKPEIRNDKTFLENRSQDRGAPVRASFVPRGALANDTAYIAMKEKGDYDNTQYAVSLFHELSHFVQYGENDYWNNELIAECLGYTLANFASDKDDAELKESKKLIKNLSLRCKLCGCNDGEFSAFINASVRMHIADLLSEHPEILQEMKPFKFHAFGDVLILSDNW